MVTRYFRLIASEPVYEDLSFVFPGPRKCPERFQHIVIPDKISDRAFELLHRVVARACPPAAVQDAAVLLWAQLHGLVMLKADGLVMSSLSQLVEKSLAGWVNAGEG